MPYSDLSFRALSVLHKSRYLFNKHGFHNVGVDRIVREAEVPTLAARLSYYSATSGGLLSCLPLQLTLRGKSTTQSYRQPLYYVDLTLREGIGLNDTITQAKQIDEQSKKAIFF